MNALQIALSMIGTGVGILMVWVLNFLMQTIKEERSDIKMLISEVATLKEQVGQLLEREGV